MAHVSISIEGGLFPADLLDRIATGSVAGQRPEDFVVDGKPAFTGRLADEMQAAFSDARSFWDAFQRRLLHSHESVTTLTRGAWIVPFLERLGFDLVYQASAVVVGGESYPISHRAGPALDAPAVHVVGVDQSLDQRPERGRRSPHALVQEYLNRSGTLWGLVTNGRQLRLLRDSARLSRPTYVEFDLAAMIQDNRYSEFVLLYRLLHRSRFPSESADAPGCWLERYFQQGIEEGGRVREHLREGVEAALKELGTAFLAHPASAELRNAFQSGRLDAPGYYRQLLRLIYRLLFLLVVEERRLLFPPNAERAERQEIYTRHYSLARLRDRCERYFADDRSSDLWQGLVQTFRLFRHDDLARQLGLAALDGELFGQNACADLEGAGCENAALLRAIYRLSTFVDGGIRRRVNYAALDVEELGSVYESLLEYRPYVNGATFDLLPGSERRQTGSYYTPPDLVRVLVEQALVPVMEERLRDAVARGRPHPQRLSIEDGEGSSRDPGRVARLGKRPEEAPTGDDERLAKERALLGLRVCDPASGSGHFLLAAARRIARELAVVRTGEAEPTPDAYRAAVREVIRTCIYAVDKNPLAVDLCKVALWIEGYNAGLPLSFLDHHVKCGDSLVGVFDLKVLDEGIPDEAYDPVAGDDRKAAAYYKKRNRAERKGQMSLEGPAADASGPSAFADDFETLAALDDRTTRDVQAKAELYASLRGGTRWLTEKIACDLWTAAFFLPPELREDGQPGLVPTTDIVRQALARPNALNGQLVGAAVALSEKHPFFHWPLEFPEVFREGGFDVVVGNPPFLGGLKIRESNGDRYRKFLEFIYAPAGGTADLCAYFYRRAYCVLEKRGCLGMVATNSIAQGDTREAGLATILRGGGKICWARRFVKWPGAASVEVNLLVIGKHVAPEGCLLDGADVPFISSRLDAEPEGAPSTLNQNRGKAFIGSYVRGIGFVLEASEAQQLLASREENRHCILPYLTGEDLNAQPDQSPTRFVICFFDWPLVEAQAYPELVRLVEERVKPERDRVREKPERERWWLFARYRVEMQRAIAPLGRVLVRSEVSELHMLSFVPTGLVYSHMVVVFAFDDDYHFALLQSNAHEAWVWKHASSLEARNRYTPTDCFDNFPFPQEPTAANRKWAALIGETYHEHRRRTMLARGLGLTKTYNLFHDERCRDQDVVRLRDLHAELDRAILACYGWEDLDPGHGFHPNERGQLRYTISPDARRELLRRLLDLNLRIAAEETSARGRVEGR